MVCARIRSPSSRAIRSRSARRSTAPESAGSTPGSSRPASTCWRSWMSARHGATRATIGIRAASGWPSTADSDCRRPRTTCGSTSPRTCRTRAPTSWSARDSRDRSSALVSDSLPRPEPWRRAPRICALVGALLLIASQGFALELQISPPRERNGYVYIDAGVTDPFSTRTTGSLQRGMPATLEVRAELWHRRTGWFDSFEGGFDARVRIQYEAWRPESEQWRIERAGAPPIYVSRFVLDA